MDKTYLGRSIEDFAPGIESKPITKVELLDENGDIVGVAGTDSGKTLTAQNPDGNNEMAQAILAKVSGYTHIGYEGQNAMLDPAAEIGDAVTVSGHYVPIVSTDSTFDSLLAVNISAPDADELDDEYPYKSKTQRQIERNMAVTRSLITKSAEETFPMPVETAVNDIASRMGVIVDSRTVLDSNFPVQYPVDDEGDMTMREALSRIAVANAGNWVISDNGELLLVGLNSVPAQTNYLITNTGDAILFGGTRILV